MPESIVTLPETFLADVTTIMSILFNDLSDYIILIIGVLLTLTAISILIGAFHK